MNLTSNKDIKRVISILLCLVLLMGVVSFAMVKYVEKSIYKERATYLSAQTHSVSEIINKTIIQNMNYATIFSNYCDAELKDANTVYSYLNYMSTKFNPENSRLILVDSNGTWYGADNLSGKITVPKNYASDTEEELIYITTGVLDDSESIVSRVTLKEPVYVSTGQGQVLIRHCAVVYFMGALSEQLKTTFPYDSNCFIIDNTGLMLYKQFDLGKLIQGNNIFTKYRDVEFKYREDSIAQIESLKNGETIVGEFSVNGTDYFICSSPLDMNDWYVTYLLESESLGAGEYIKVILVFILLLGLLLSMSVIIAGISISGIKINRQRLDAQKEANALLEKASSAKSDFLSNMSHDIRTPINGILGMTALALKEDNSKATNEYLRKIDISANYLFTLVSDVLDMSRIESGNEELNPEELDMLAFSNNIKDIISGQITGRELNFVTKFDNIDGLFVMADEKKLRSILINILGNATKFTPDGGTITLSVERLESIADGKNGADDRSIMGEKANMRFVVSDTGIGMDPEFQKHIWDRFSQASNKSRSTFKGTGLGMAITKSFVDLMGGTINLESEENAGSTFTIDLCFDQIEKAEGQEANTSEILDISGATILVAEDNEINMEITKAVLEDHGVIVEEAVNGEEAVKVFFDSDINHFDMILMDVMMPVMNGLEATKAIRALDRADARTVPIIAMTANNYDEDIRKVLDAGMNDHLSKPIDINRTIKTIFKYIRKGGEIDE